MELALAQRALGHEVSVAVDRRRTAHTSEELIVPRLADLHLLSDVPLELSVKSPPWNVLRDVLVLRSQPLDVIHAHFTHDHILARLARPKGVALFRSMHAPRSIRRSAPRADGFTVPTPCLARGLLGQRVLVLPALVGNQFVPPGDRRVLRAELGLPSCKLVGMVSTFQSSRRHELGLAAYAALREDGESTTLVLVGDGPLEAQLRARATEGVSFVGYHSGSAFVRYLQALDEVWILGLGNDWSARAAAQARACGVRVLAIDEGALARYADEVVEPNIESLVRASRSDARREAAIESSEAVARRVLDFYCGSVGAGAWG